MEDDGATTIFDEALELLAGAMLLAFGCAVVGLSLGYILGSYSA